MTSITLSVDATSALAQLQALANKAAKLRPLMLAIGESLAESTKQRFSTGRAPDGAQWLPNSQVTIERYLDRYSGTYGKTGRITKKGAQRASSKRPLIGETSALSTTINYTADDRGVSVGSPMIYAAVQQFGADAREFGKAPWGKIPDRPFLGVSADDDASIAELTTTYLAP